MFSSKAKESDKFLLNEMERTKALRQVGNRTESEKMAYRKLPYCMKKCVVCNITDRVSTGLHSR